jgi:hypothetical protein
MEFLWRDFMRNYRVFSVYFATLPVCFSLFRSSVEHQNTFSWAEQRINVRKDGNVAKLWSEELVANKEPGNFHKNFNQSPYRFARDHWKFRDAKREFALISWLTESIDQLSQLAAGMCSRSQKVVEKRSDFHDPLCFLPVSLLSSLHFTSQPSKKPLFEHSQLGTKSAIYRCD